MINYGLRDEEQGHAADTVSCGDSAPAPLLSHCPWHTAYACINLHAAAHRASVAHRDLCLRYFSKLRQRPRRGHVWDVTCSTAQERWPHYINMSCMTGRHGASTVSRSSSCRPVQKLNSTTVLQQRDETRDESTHSHRTFVSHKKSSTP